MGVRVAQDSSLTAVDATMYLTGKDLWPFTDAKQSILVSALYDNIMVKPIDIRITKDSLESNSRRRSRMLLQVRRHLFREEPTKKDLSNSINKYGKENV